MGRSQPQLSKIVADAAFLLAEAAALGDVRVTPIFSIVGPEVMAPEKNPPPFPPPKNYVQLVRRGGESRAPRCRWRACQMNPFITEKIRPAAPVPPASLISSARSRAKAHA